MLSGDDPGFATLYATDEPGKEQGAISLGLNGLPARVVAFSKGETQAAVLAEMDYNVLTWAQRNWRQGLLDRVNRRLCWLVKQSDEYQAKVWLQLSIKGYFAVVDANIPSR